RALNHIRERQATYEVIEGRALADGDFAQVALDGKPREGEGQPVHMDDVLVEIGGTNTMPEFTQNLRGTSAGDEKTFEVKYPEDSDDKRLAGKTFDYTVKVLSLKHKNLPELNDTFAQEVGEFKAMDELRKTLRENIEADKRHTAEHESKDKLVAELV